MKKKIVSLLMATAMLATTIVGCGGAAPAAEAPAEEVAAPAEEAAAPAEEAAQTESTGEKEVLEFYHGYYHDESEWAPAKAMRDIFDEFAATHADGNVEFKHIPVENGAELAQNMIAGGSFPDIIDYAGSAIPLAAISGGLLLDVKPYIDANGLKDAVGINYTQNDVDGAIYTVHDQLLTRGIWYNTDIVEGAGLTVDDIQTWDGFEKLVDSVDYAYIAGQSSMQLLTAKLASDGNADLITSPMTADLVKSDAFANAFKAVAALDQKNGSDHTTNDVGNMMADFNTNGNVAVLHNGVWNASGIGADLFDKIQPALFPGNLSILQAGGGITIASGMSADKEALALEFLAYMVSPEVQEKIFSQVQANPCNTTVDVVAIANGSDDPAVAKLAEACDLCNSAKVQVPGLVWDGDIVSVITNAFMECAVSGADIEARYAQLVDEIVAIVG